MANRVILHPDGYIEHSYDGDQNSELLAQSIRQSEDYIVQLKKSKKPIAAFIDITHIGKIPTATRKLALDSFTSIYFDKVAFFGSSPFTTALINLIAHASGKSERIKTFAIKAEALKWLMRDDS